MPRRASVVAIAAGVLIMGSSVPALAGEPGADPAIVDPPIAIDGAGVERGSVTDTPVAGADTESGADSTEALEEDLPLPGEVDGPDLGDGGVQPKGQPGCTPGGVVRVTRNLKNTMSVKYATFIQNKKSYKIDFKFTSKKSGTTTIGSSVTVSSEFKMLWLGKIKVDVNVSAQKSWTSELGVETGGKVKAHSTVYGDYGIKKENIYGYTGTRYSNCEIDGKRHMKAWAPYREGWVIR
ncbi:hypothetical protein [Streptomyces cucumeris]|uniref:hypothetical protein n=1 Tax=Streptomyces cucumeris TaxID=2962890 RepID=UPI0020C8E353|nr:hypothetical protein [Streptomyces sp. NEAU-Y11]MCP9206077.1 hypothetical protein [Streptomyces sp. NEAU-Y11]